MILEVAILHIKSGLSLEFEKAFDQAKSIIQAQKGFIDLQLKKCIEAEDKYLLLVNWETIEDHTIGFRTSLAYQDWKILLHHFYDPFPVVEHYQ